MTSQVRHIELYRAEFDKLYTDATYSAQTYYEAAKSADFTGRAIVYIPALLAAVASLLIILGLSKNWGVVGVASGIITATSSFLGTQQKAAAFRNSGNSFTKLRHDARMWRDTFVEVQPESDAIDALKTLQGKYSDIVEGIQLPANRFFQRASNRISSKILEYDGPAQGSKRRLDRGSSSSGNAGSTS